MRILFDHGTPSPLAPYLAGHSVTEARERGWDTLSNGDLLRQAEIAGFEVLITADNNMLYQQNLSGRKISLLVLSTPQWPRVKLQIDKIIAALDAITAGSYIEVEIPYLA